MVIIQYSVQSACGSHAIVILLYNILLYILISSCRVDGKDPAFFFCNEAQISKTFVGKIKELKYNVDKQCYSYCTAEERCINIQISLCGLIRIAQLHNYAKELEYNNIGYNV